MLFEDNIEILVWVGNGFFIVFLILYRMLYIDLYMMLFFILNSKEIYFLWGSNS